MFISDVLLKLHGTAEMCYLSADAVSVFAKTIWQLLRITATIRAEGFCTIQPHLFWGQLKYQSLTWEKNRQQMKTIYLEGTVRHFINPQTHTTDMPKKLRIATKYFQQKCETFI